MSRETRLTPSALTGEVPAVAVAVCACADDVHRWSAPVVGVVDTARITRWRCTCPHCQCDGLHLTIDPNRRDPIGHTCRAVVPVGSVRAAAGEIPMQRSGKWAEFDGNLYERVLAGIAAL